MLGWPLLLLNLTGNNLGAINFMKTGVEQFSISFVNPATGVPLNHVGDTLIDSEDRSEIARIVDQIPRFVEPGDNYAESFGWQWKHWRDNQSESRGASVKQRELILERTHFAEYDLAGKTVLECGMGGGDDTEVLLTLPFSEIHSFDLSTAVERAQHHLHDERLKLSQASIYAIPYPDRVFDFVFCHRVLQHTPDPEKSLRCICKKVKSCGILFIHSYKRSPEHMAEWRYKYRWFTTRVPKEWIYYYVQCFGWLLHHFVDFFYQLGGPYLSFAYRYFPFYRVNRTGVYAMDKKEAIELEKMITFDALTPRYDSPMTTSQLKSILTDEGFVIEHIEDRFPSPVYATARKNLVD